MALTQQPSIRTPPPKAPNQLNYSRSGCARACGAQGEAVGAMGTPPLPPPLAAVFSPPPPNGTGSGGETPADEEAIDSLAVFTQLLTLLTCILAGYFLHTRRITVMHEVRQRSSEGAHETARGGTRLPPRVHAGPGRTRVLAAECRMGVPHGRRGEARCASLHALRLAQEGYSWVPRLCCCCACKLRSGRAARLLECSSADSARAGAGIVAPRRAWRCS